MASPSNYHHLLLLFLVYASSIEAAAETSNFRVKALVLPVTKDPSTNLYGTILFQRTPLVLLNFTLDLGGNSLWLDCDQGYLSSSYTPARCGSPECSLAGSNSCVTRLSFFLLYTCALLAYNTVTNTAANGQVGVDVVVLRATDGLNLARFVSVPKFIFVCVSTNLLQGLANNVQGMAGFGRSPISLASQFSAAFSIDRKFAICLTSSTDANRGLVFFGDSPYVLLPDNIDFSRSLIYTPLIHNPVSSDYFIGVNSIKINGNTVPLNKELLKIDKNGHGGTKISTVDPYTVMETSIYQAFVNVFNKELAQEVPRVEAVAPFTACFNSTFVAITLVGRAVPEIDLELQSNDVVWRISGANSMVQVRVDVLCLGFVDAGLNPRTSIVIGGHQLENNLLEFNLETSKLGFSSSLLSRRTNCDNFNFTVIP